MPVSPSLQQGAQGLHGHRANVGRWPDARCRPCPTSPGHRRQTPDLSNTKGVITRQFKGAFSEIVAADEDEIQKAISGDLSKKRRKLCVLQSRGAGPAGLGRDGDTLSLGHPLGGGTGLAESLKPPARHTRTPAGPKLC